MGLPIIQSAARRGSCRRTRLFAGCPAARAPSGKEATRANGEVPACGEAALSAELLAAAPRLPVDVDHGVLLGGLCGVVWRHDPGQLGWSPADGPPHG